MCTFLTLWLCDIDLRGSRLSLLTKNKLPSFAKVLLNICLYNHRVKTPNYELFGAMTVDVRVNISGDGWTVNKIQYIYFANTTAKNCIAYGPGILSSVRHSQSPFRGKSKNKFCRLMLFLAGDIFPILKTIQQANLCSFYVAFPSEHPKRLITQILDTISHLHCCKQVLVCAAAWKLCETAVP